MLGCITYCKRVYSKTALPAQIRLAAKIRNDIEQSRVGTLWIAFQNASINILRKSKVHDKVKLGYLYTLHIFGHVHSRVGFYRRSN